MRQSTRARNAAPRTTARTAALTAAALAGALGAQTPTATSTEQVRDEPLRVLIAPQTDEAHVQLGKRLFHEPLLSKDGTVSCASCHVIAAGGDDGRAVSIGIGGAMGPINSPTVINAGLNFRQFWDGRARTLMDQIDEPIQNPLEMGSLWEDIIAKLNDHAFYGEAINTLFPTEGISRNTVRMLIAEYMRALVALDSPFDQWLRGDDAALTTRQTEGYRLFKAYGCYSCHQGRAVGGNAFQQFGVHNDYFKKRGNITDADRGRYNVTGNPEDMHRFKIPSLRMARDTAPYLHDGNAATLRDAVDAMFEFQIGRTAPDEHKTLIAEFIETLAGTVRPELLPD